MDNIEGYDGWRTTSVNATLYPFGFTTSSAEEKREAIKQLSFSLEHYRSGYKKLRQSFEIEAGKSFSLISAL